MAAGMVMMGSPSSCSFDQAGFTASAYDVFILQAACRLS